MTIAALLAATALMATACSSLGDVVGGEDEPGDLRRAAELAISIEDLGNAGPSVSSAGSTGSADDTTSTTVTSGDGSAQAPTDASDSPVRWESEPICAPDRTIGMQAEVTNESGRAAGYRVVLLDPANGNQVHASHHYVIADQATGTTLLGGIPPGTWELYIYEQQLDGSDSRLPEPARLQAFDVSVCDET